MPFRDKYGTQEPIALLKFLIERGSMYDRTGDDSKGEFLVKKTYRDLQFMAAMAPPGGGRNPVDERFISLYNVISILEPSRETLQKIYSSILGHWVKNFTEDIQNVVDRLTNATLTLYENAVTYLVRSPTKFHYLFNLRDLSRVYEGMCLSTTDKFTTVAQFVRLWRNECLRVFHDRLISA